MQNSENKTAGEDLCNSPSVEFAALAQENASPTIKDQLPVIQEGVEFVSLTRSTASSQTPERKLVYRENYKNNSAFVSQEARDQHFLLKRSLYDIFKSYLKKEYDLRFKRAVTQNAIQHYEEIKKCHSGLSSEDQGRQKALQVIIRDLVHSHNTGGVHHASGHDIRLPGLCGPALVVASPVLLSSIMSFMLLKMSVYLIDEFEYYMRVKAPRAIQWQSFKEAENLPVIKTLKSLVATPYLIILTFTVVSTSCLLALQHKAKKTHRWATYAFHSLSPFALFFSFIVGTVAIAPSTLGLVVLTLKNIKSCLPSLSIFFNKNKSDINALRKDNALEKKPQLILIEDSPPLPLNTIGNTDIENVMAMVTERPKLESIETCNPLPGDDKNTLQDMPVPASPEQCHYRTLNNPNISMALHALPGQAQRTRSAILLPRAGDASLDSPPSLFKAAKHGRALSHTSLESPLKQPSNRF